MAIQFDTKHWDAIKDSHRRWWAGELERPLLHFTISGHDSHRPESLAPSRQFNSSHPLELTADAIVDGWDFKLSSQRFMGDAFPCVWPNFGPGVVAAFSGCKLENGPDTVWFSHPMQQSIEDIHISFNPDSSWLHRIKDIMEATQRRWQGNVQVGMTDLGGTLDIIASFRESEPLLMDLYDSPGEVIRR